MQTFQKLIFTTVSQLLNSVNIFLSSSYAVQEQLKIELLDWS